MIGEASFYGIYVPWLMVLCGFALAVSWAVRRVLAAIGFYRWVWHPALFDLALYALCVWALSRLTAPLSS